MGKIKVRVLGDESAEEQQKNKAKQKGKEKSASRRTVKGGKGGERIVSVGPSEEELARIEVPRGETPRGTRGTRKPRDTRKNSHSKSYQAIAQVVDHNKKYDLNEALSLLEKLKRGEFDETVELHINTIEPGVSGSIVLPHGTGKIIKVAIADDDVLAQVQKGKIDFDILLASPLMMPKLARVAKILGPRGLMPNPKNGTLTKDPQRLALSFAKGQMNFKTEAKAPIMHLTVGKMSFGAKKLSENISTLIDAITKEKIRNVTLKSTMSPGIKIQL